MKKIIETKTKEYIKALLETQEVAEYITASHEFKNDSDAKKLLSDLQELQQTYNVLRQGNFTGVAEQERKVKLLQDKVSKNTKIQTLIRTQQAMYNLVGDLATQISQAINFPFAQPQRGGCCG